VKGRAAHERESEREPESVAEIEAQLAALDEQLALEEHTARRSGERAALTERLAKARAAETAAANSRDLGSLALLDAAYQARLGTVLERLRDLDPDLAALERFGSASIALRARLRDRGVSVAPHAVNRVSLGRTSAQSIEAVRALVVAFAALRGPREWGLWVLPAAR
jgi:hypothetical protein